MEYCWLSTKILTITKMICSWLALSPKVSRPDQCLRAAFRLDECSIYSSVLYNNWQHFNNYVILHVTKAKMSNKWIVKSRVFAVRYVLMIYFVGASLRLRVVWNKYALRCWYNSAVNCFIFIFLMAHTSIKVKKDCFWKQRTHNITKIGDSVWLSLFICNTVVCEAAYAP